MIYADVKCIKTFFPGNVCLVQIERDPYSTIMFPETSAATPKPAKTSAAYLKVPNYNLYLEVHEEEYCLPKERPRLCPNLSWKHLNRVFLGIGCKPLKHVTNVKVSAYFFQKLSN